MGASTQTTRRALIGGAGLAGVALLAPAIAAIAPTIRTPSSDRTAWGIALRRFETEAHAYRDSMVAFDRDEERYFANKSDANSEAYDIGQKHMLDCCGRCCDAVYALVALPAPDAAAVIIKAQVALDSGLIGNDSLADTLAADLRRFSNYARQEG